MQVRISMAMTADGKSADEEGEWYPLCKYERERFYNNIRWSEALIVGADTVLTTDITFLPPKCEKPPFRVVIDPNMKTGPERKVYDVSKGPSAVVVSEKSLTEKARKAESFTKNGIEVISMKSEDGYINVRELLRILNKRGVEKVLVVGGGRTNWFFFKEGLVSEYWITVTPYVMGGTRYTPVSGEGFHFPGIKMRLTESFLCKCGEEVVLKYALKESIQP